MSRWMFPLAALALLSLSACGADDGEGETEAGGGESESVPPPCSLVSAADVTAVASFDAAVGREDAAVGCCLFDPETEPDGLIQLAQVCVDVNIPTLYEDLTAGLGNCEDVDDVGDAACFSMNGLYVKRGIAVLSVSVRNSPLFKDEDGGLSPEEQRSAAISLARTALDNWN